MNLQSISTRVAVVGEEGAGLNPRFLAWETGRGGASHQVGEPKRRAVWIRGKLSLGPAGFEIAMEHPGRGQEPMNNGPKLRRRTWGWSRRSEV